jgi:aspartate kinase
VQNVSPKGEKHTDISFTLDKAELAKAKKAMEPLVKELGAESVNSTEGIAKLSVVGVGMRSHSGVAAAMFEALAETGVNIEMISTSEIKISVVIGLDKAEKAANAVHEKFGLGKLKS